MDEVTPDPITDGSMLQQMGTDAQMWAQEWCRVAQRIADRAEPGIHVIDQGWMISWFANAIEAGRDAAMRSQRGASSQGIINASSPSPVIDTAVVGDRWRGDLNRAIRLLYPNAKKYLSMEMIDKVIHEELEKVIASRQAGGAAIGQRRARYDEEEEG